MHLTLDQFRADLLSKPPTEVAESYLFVGTPYVFRNRPALYHQLRELLHKNLAVDRHDIHVIGSAKTGFSLSPDNYFREFSDDSDIDIIVISESLFDHVWKTILVWNYPRRYKLGGRDLYWVWQRMDDIFWGWFRPDKIRFTGLSFPAALTPLRDLSTRWFDAFQGLSRHHEFAARHVSGRLYRNKDHAILYHSEGLKLVKQILLAQQPGGTDNGL